MLLASSSSFFVLALCCSPRRGLARAPLSPLSVVKSQRRLQLSVSKNERIALDEAFRKTFFSFLFFFPAGDGATSQETFFARSVSLFLNADSPFATLPPGWLSGEAAGEL